jgi:acyl-CoA synthetase (AMP-forming)/AMP-acid ligase II
VNLLTLLDMAAAGHGDRLLLGTSARGLTGEQLAERSRRGARFLTAAGAHTVVYIGENGLAVPLALFAAAAAGVPFLPLNYRLTTEQLESITRSSHAPSSSRTGFRRCPEGPQQDRRPSGSGKTWSPTRIAARACLTP